MCFPPKGGLILYELKLSIYEYSHNNTSAIFTKKRNARNKRNIYIYNNTNKWDSFKLPVTFDLLILWLLSSIWACIEFDFSEPLCNKNHLSLFASTYDERTCLSILKYFSCVRLQLSSSIL